MTKRRPFVEADVYNGQTWIGRLSPAPGGKIDVFIVKPDGASLKRVGREDDPTAAHAALKAARSGQKVSL